MRTLRSFAHVLIFPTSLLVGVVLASMIFTLQMAKRFDFAPALGQATLGVQPWPLAILNLVALGALAVLLCRWVPYLPPLLAVPPGFALVTLLSHPLYPPFAGFQWAAVLYRHPVGQESIFWAALPAIAALVGLGAIGHALQERLRWSVSTAEAAATATRYATFKEVKAAGLLRPGGIILGYFRRGLFLYPLTDDSHHHTLWIMPTDSRKRARPFIPSLLTRTHSAFVLDPDGEMCEATAGWRAAQGHRCIRLAPLEDPAVVDRWNPLSEIEKGPNEVEVLGLMGEALITANLGEDSKWDESARALFRCLALHILYTEKIPTFGHIRALAHAGGGLRKLLGWILVAKHDPDLERRWRDPEKDCLTTVHPEALVQARGLLQRPDEELASITARLQEALALWADPQVLASTAFSDFDLGVVNGSDPVTIYCVAPHRDLQHLAPWIRLLVAILVRRITLRPVIEQALSLDLYLDGFANLGRVTALHQVLSFLRGHRVRAHIREDAYSDLERIYGRDEAISSSSVHVVAAAASRRFSEIPSALASQIAAWWPHARRGVGGVQSFRPPASHRTTEIRPVIKSGDVASLGDHEILIAKAGLSLIRAEKNFSIKNRFLRGRAALPPPWRGPRGVESLPIHMLPLWTPDPSSTLRHPNKETDEASENLFSSRDEQHYTQDDASRGDRER